MDPFDEEEEERRREKQKQENEFDEWLDGLTNNDSIHNVQKSSHQQHHHRDSLDSAFEHDEYQERNDELDLFIAAELEKEGRDVVGDDEGKTEAQGETSFQACELPERDPTMEDVEKLLAQELKSMKVEEREKIYEQIHGVDGTILETPEFVQEKLRQMNVELDKIVTKMGSTIATTTAPSPSSSSSTKSRTFAYQQAKMRNEKYVLSLRLMFLRTDFFDVTKAANRMIEFFWNKLELFGQDSLARPLILSKDFSTDDMACMKVGHIQLLPFRDSSGRALFITTPDTSIKPYKHISNMVRTFVYIMLAAAESEETQKRGIVFIGYKMKMESFEEKSVGTSSSSKRSNSGDSNGSRSGIDREKYHNIPPTLNWLPIRNVAVHFCIDNPIVKAVMAAIMTAGPKFLRAQIRAHYGSPTECNYSLMTFGIPTESIPLTAGGVVKLDNHKKWLTRRTAKDRFLFRPDKTKKKGKGGSGERKKKTSKSKMEESSNQEQQQEEDIVVATNGTTEDPFFFDGVDFPGPNDVLLGRGKPFRNHSGNVRMRQLVENHRAIYDKLGGGAKNSSQPSQRQQPALGQKMKLAEQIVLHIRTQMRPPGRFLTVHPQHGWWVEVSTTEAAKRVCQVFRTARAVGPSSGRDTTSSIATGRPDGNGGEGRYENDDNRLHRLYNKRSKVVVQGSAPPALQQPFLVGGSINGSCFGSILCGADCTTSNNNNNKQGQEKSDNFYQQRW